jgi:hypothetical protein
MGLEPLIDAPPGGDRRRVRLVRALVAAAVVAFAAGLTAAAVGDEPSSLGLATVGNPAPAPASPTDLDEATTTTRVTVAPTTATTPATVPVTAPVVKIPVSTVTVPTLARPRPTTTTTTTTTASAPAGDRCGTPSGSGDLGATRSVTEGAQTVTLEVYACEHYEGEFTQNFVHVDTADAVLKAVHLDFGDGTSTDVGVYRWGCADPRRPNPYHANGPIHTYTAPGDYIVTATVTTVSCLPTDSSLDERTTTVSLTTYQIAGPRPRPAPG